MVKMVKIWGGRICFDFAPRLFVCLFVCLFVYSVSVAFKESFFSVGRGC